MTSRSERSRFRVRRQLVPLLAYLGVTVAFPALGGAARLEGFWDHAAITLGVSGAFAGAWLGGRGWAERRWRRARSGTCHVAVPGGSR